MSCRLKNLNSLLYRETQLSQGVDSQWTSMQSLIFYTTFKMYIFTINNNHVENNIYALGASMSYLYNTCEKLNRKYVTARNSLHQYTPPCLLPKAWLPCQCEPANIDAQESGLGFSVFLFSACHFLKFLFIIYVSIYLLYFSITI